MNTIRYFGLGFVLVGIAAGASATERKYAKSFAKARKAVPAIAFSSPADESSISSTIAVRAASTQVEKVKAVTFLLDGDEIAKSAGSTGAFKWDTTKIGDGWHTLSAIAKDTSGKETTANVAVMVHNFVDRVAPGISIEWPMDGNLKDNWLATRVHVVDNIGVTSVETYIDGKLVATSNVAPFDTRWNWSKLSKGPHTLQTKAYDAAGNSSSSAPLTITK
jgi:hypothetical protein